MTAQRIEKWTRWIDDPIKNDVLNMHLQRDAWRKVADMLASNADELPDSYWWQFMRDTYAATQAVAVRRQADTHKDVASLGRLIEQIRDDSRLITRDFWLALWTHDHDDPFSVTLAERAWADKYGGGVGKHLDPAIPAADFERLTTTSAESKRYVDQRVAHADASKVSAAVTLTLEDVHDAVEVIGELFRRYYTLLTAADMARLVPVIQHDWMAAFRVPWMRAQQPRTPEPPPAVR